MLGMKCNAKWQGCSVLVGAKYVTIWPQGRDQKTEKQKKYYWQYEIDCPTRVQLDTIRIRYPSEDDERRTRDVVQLVCKKTGRTIFGFQDC